MIEPMLSGVSSCGMSESPCWRQLGEVDSIAAASESVLTASPDRSR